MAKNLTLPAIRVAQLKGQKDIFITSIKIKDLIDENQFSIDLWNPNKKTSTDQGYQRWPAETHIKKIASYATNEKDSVFPTAILINCRNPVRFEGKDGMGKLTMSHPPFWIVDGQHRIKGLKYAIEELDDQQWNNKELPVVVLSNFERIEEVNQFSILNSTQKRIATDLAQRLLSDMVMDSPSERKKMTEDNKIWIVRVLKVIDLLNEKTESPWYKMIRLPNTNKLATNIVNQNSFVKSLQPIFRDGYFSSLKKLDKNYEILRDYWLALKEIYPAAFLSPRDYVIQKTPGIFSLHSLVHAITLRGLPKYSKETFREILEKVFINGKKEDYYWQADNLDGAAIFGSMKGFRILAEEFKENLEN